ncbi:MAG: glycosyltransferase [Verrucomicrobia bacterium]|jgi:ceramide glucosyltransferase|nr:glycosyltransferase [Verrucomicrobiota bacterium]
MAWKLVLAVLATLSCGLTVWQHIVARRFALHRKNQPTDNTSAVTLLKPLKGIEPGTEDCLRSWFTQNYRGPVQILLGVADLNDPVCLIVKKLRKEFPAIDAQLIHCGRKLGTNAKVSSLIQLRREARHEIIVISDADVFVSQDFLEQNIPLLTDEKVGLVNFFYQLGEPLTPAMRWEAVAINGDFWSQVLQSRSLKPIDFALGAVMITREKQLKEIGGFEELAEYLADDYRLGNLIAKRGYRIELSGQVVECRSQPMTWSEVWKHQFRWARTIRICQPAPYFMSILSNATLWPLLWLLVNPTISVAMTVAAYLLIRIYTASANQQMLTRNTSHLPWLWLIPIKDICQVMMWALSFLTTRIVWRGTYYNVSPGGKLVESA